MPTTSYVSPTVSVSTIGARTDSAGAAVSDLAAEEARLAAQILTEGYLTPSTAFRVQAQTVPDMTVKVGSGTAKADHYVVAGEVGGQGNYLVRLDVASQNVTISAADASQTRTDEIYLVVRDNVYDASSRALPQLGYRQGDLGGANPGPDAAWRASVLLARVAVAAAVTSITSGNITEQRGTSALLSALLPTGDYIGGLRGVRQTTDLVRTSTTVTANTELSVSVATNGVYLVQGLIKYTSTAVDVKFVLTGPSGTSGVASTLFSGIDDAAVGPAGDTTWAASAGAATLGSSSESMGAFFSTSIVVGGTAGNLLLSFGQDVASATSSTFVVGSWMTLLRIA